MKNLLTIASTLIIGLALTVTACGKDKKPATDPAKAEPAAAEPAKPEPAAGEPKAEDKPKTDEKPAAGGW